MASEATLAKIAQELRLEIVEMIYRAGSGHAGGSLSCVEILTVLYEKVLRIKPQDPQWADRDRFVLSKGHAAPALYCMLARKGFYDVQELVSLRRLDSRLQGHPCMFKLPGIEMSTGSLGMGISIGVGMALAAKQQQRSYRVYVLCGDGELQEGQNWEAMMAAVKWNLNNLVIIIDRNHVQLDGKEAEIMPLGNLEDKLKAFGLYTLSCNGHDCRLLLDAFAKGAEVLQPKAIIAETVKGKGVSFMEGQSAWHGKKITEPEYLQAIREIKEGYHE
jgi:transketolase